MCAIPKTISLNVQWIFELIFNLVGVCANDKCMISTLNLRLIAMSVAIKRACRYLYEQARIYLVRKYNF